MLGSIGMPELIIIFVIALVVFGPRRLPELGRSLGQGISEFKRATTHFTHSLEEEIRVDGQRHDPISPQAPPPAPTGTSADRVPEA